MLIKNEGRLGHNMVISYRNNSLPARQLINDGGFEQEFRDAFVLEGSASEKPLMSIFDSRLQKLARLRSMAPGESLPELLGPGWKDVDAECPGSCYELKDTTSKSSITVELETDRLVTLSLTDSGNRFNRQVIRANYDEAGIIPETVAEAIYVRGDAQDYIISG